MSKHRLKVVEGDVTERQLELLRRTFDVKIYPKGSVPAPEPSGPFYYDTNLPIDVFDKEFFNQ